MVILWAWRAVVESLWTDSTLWQQTCWKSGRFSPGPKPEAPKVLLAQHLLRWAVQGGVCVGLSGARGSRDFQLGISGAVHPTQWIWGCLHSPNCGAVPAVWWQCCKTLIPCRNTTLPDVVGKSIRRLLLGIMYPSSAQSKQRRSLEARCLWPGCVPLTRDPVLPAVHMAKAAESRN